MTCFSFRLAVFKILFKLIQHLLLYKFVEFNFVVEWGGQKNSAAENVQMKPYLPYLMMTLGLANPVSNLPIKQAWKLISTSICVRYEDSPAGSNIYTKSEMVFWFGQIAKELFRHLEFSQKNVAFTTHEKVL